MCSKRGFDILASFYSRPPPPPLPLKHYTFTLWKLLSGLPYRFVMHLRRFCARRIRFECLPTVYCLCVTFTMSFAFFTPFATLSLHDEPLSHNHYSFRECTVRTFPNDIFSTSSTSKAIQNLVTLVMKCMRRSPLFSNGALINKATVRDAGICAHTGLMLVCGWQT